jgi:hypothetical protein
MQLSIDTMIMLARSGDEQAVKVLRSMEVVRRDTKFFYQIEPGIFCQVPERRHPTIIGIPWQS